MQVAFCGSKHAYKQHLVPKHARVLVTVRIPHVAPGQSCIHAVLPTRFYPSNTLIFGPQITFTISYRSQVSNVGNQDQLLKPSISSHLVAKAILR